MLPKKILDAVYFFKEAREHLIYKLAWARATLKAPPGRYAPEDLLELRALVEEIEKQFPELVQKKP